MRLVGPLADFQADLDWLPFALVYDSLLQRLRQSGADDMADLLGLEQGYYDFVVETAVGVKQAHLGIA